MFFFLQKMKTIWRCVFLHGDMRPLDLLRACIVCREWRDMIHSECVIWDRWHHQVVSELPSLGIVFNDFKSKHDSFLYLFNIVYRVWYLMNLTGAWARYEWRDFLVGVFTRNFREAFLLAGHDSDAKKQFKEFTFVYDELRKVEVVEISYTNDMKMRFFYEFLEGRRCEAYVFGSGIQMGMNAIDPRAFCLPFYDAISCRDQRRFCDNTGELHDEREGPQWPCFMSFTEWDFRVGECYKCNKRALAHYKCVNCWVMFCSFECMNSLTDRERAFHGSCFDPEFEPQLRRLGAYVPDSL
jgi:hypothetical protein